MPPSVTPALQRECHISASQEEVLANLGGGWERSVHFVVDDTPSQHVATMANVVASAVPNGNEAVSAGSSSDSDDSDFHILGYTQEPVEWYSPPSSSTHDEKAKENENIVMDESYNAAFESDRSQSPDQHSNEPVKHPEPEDVSDGAESDGETPMEPASGAMYIQPLEQMDDEETGEMHSQPLMGDEETGVLHSQPLMGDGETGVLHSQPLMGDGEIGAMHFQPLTQQMGDGETGETEDQGAMEDVCKSQPKLKRIAETQLSIASTHCWSPTRAAAVNHTGRNVSELMSVQPITQPAYETQPSELPMEVFTIPLRNRPYFVQPDRQIQRERSIDEVVPANQLLPHGKSADVSRTTQDLPPSSVVAAPDIDQGSGDDLIQCVKSRTDETDIEHNPCKLKRTADIRELNGQEKQQRVEGSTRRVRRCPNTGSIDEAVPPNQLLPHGKSADVSRTTQDVPQSSVVAAPDIDQGSGDDLIQCVKSRTDETDIERNPCKLKRTADIRELNGQEKQQRVEGSTGRVRRCPNTGSIDEVVPANQLLPHGKSADVSRTTQDLPQSSVVAAPDIDQGSGDDLIQCVKSRTDEMDIERNPCKSNGTADFRELNGQEKQQRVEGSTGRVRRCPNTGSIDEVVPANQLLPHGKSADVSRTTQDVPQSSVVAAPDIDQGSGDDLIQCVKSRTDEMDIERNPCKSNGTADLRELNGQEKQQRVEGSTRRVRRCPNTGSIDEVVPANQLLPHGKSADVSRTTKDVPQSSVVAAPDIDQGSGDDLIQCVKSRTDETDIERNPCKSNGTTDFRELNGQEKQQRVEGSTRRIRRCPNTVMDVVRFQPTPMSSPLDEDDCNILRILMRTGVSFPPLVHKKPSV